MLERDLEGLVPSPEPTHLYVELGKDPDGTVYGWHTYTRVDDKSTPIYSPAVRGILTGITMKQQEFQGKKNLKIDFRVKSGDRVWIIRSGVDTVFTRGVLLALDMIEDLTQPIVIHAKPADTSVYGNVFLSNLERVVAEYDAEKKLFPIAQALQGQLGQVPQTMAEIEQEFNDRRR